jgi:hypothetical protein
MGNVLVDIEPVALVGNDVEEERLFIRAKVELEVVTSIFRIHTCTG